MKLILRFAICFAAFALCAAQAAAQSKASHKEKLTRSVYERILRSIGVSKQAAPTLVFSYADASGECAEPCRHSCRSCNAIYSATKKSIFFGEAIYDIAAEMGADSTTAIAFALGHEIAHFYLRHEWGLPFGMYEGSDYANMAFARQLEDPDQIAKMEAQADFLGMLYAYLAGYSSPNVGVRFFRKFQTKTGWEDKFSDKYPSFSDRCRLTQDAENALKKFIPVFEAANLLLVSEEYRIAEQCYRRISKDFASREMLNNTGVAGALYTLSIMDSMARKYAYPYLYDSETRLNSSNSRRLPYDKRNFALGAPNPEKTDVAFEVDDINKNRNPHNARVDPKNAEVNTEKDTLHNAGDPTEPAEDPIKPRLLYSLECFEDALKADAEYSPAQVNIALTYCLLGDFAAATEAANKAIKMSTTAKNPTAQANAHIALGIAQAWLGNNEAAKKAFNSARSHNRLYADLNLGVVAGTTKTAKTRNEKSPSVDLSKERINDYGVKEIHEIFSTEALRSARNGGIVEEDEIQFFSVDVTDEPASELVHIYHLPTDQFGALCVEWFNDDEKEGIAQRVAYITTPNGYTGSSARGISIGSSTNDVERAYGAPFSTNATTQGQNYLYKDENRRPALIVSLDHDGKVRAWTLVCHKGAGAF